MKQVDGVIVYFVLLWIPIDLIFPSFLFFPVLFRLGEVLDPRAKLYMILYGDRGESGKIYLTPSDGTKFEPGKQYRVSVNIKDIGKVQLQLKQQCRSNPVICYQVGYELSSYFGGDYKFLNQCKPPVTACICGGLIASCRCLY